MPHQLPPILFVLVAAVLAPLAAAAGRRIGLSVVVIELLLGIAIGPQGFALVGPEQGALPALATLGMVFLFFAAGMEIDLPAIRGAPTRRAVAGWLAALLVSGAVALALRAAGLASAWQVVAIALSTTALGVLVPMLLDTGMLKSAFGRYVLASGVAGEMLPILVMSLLLARQRSTTAQAAMTLAFVAVVLVLAWGLTRGVRLPAILDPLRRGLDQSGQLPIRIAFLLIAVFAVMAESFGLDAALGALAAGMMVAFAIRGGERVHDLHFKLDAIGYGFLVPIFFVVSGMKLDVLSLTASAKGPLLLGATLAGLLLARVPLVLSLRRELGTRQAVALGLFSATTLSLIVVLTQLSVAAEIMAADEAAPIVGAGILSVLVFPPVALALARDARPEVAVAPASPDA